VTITSKREKLQCCNIWVSEIGRSESETGNETERVTRRKRERLPFAFRLLHLAFLFCTSLSTRLALSCYDGTDVIAAFPAFAAFLFFCSLLLLFSSFSHTLSPLPPSLHFAIAHLTCPRLLLLAQCMQRARSFSQLTHGFLPLPTHPNPLALLRGQGRNESESCMLV